MKIPLKATFLCKLQFCANAWDSGMCCQKHQILHYVVDTSVANIYNNKTKMHSGPPPKPVNVYGIWMKVSTMHHFHTILQTHRTKCLIMLISTYVGTEKNREILYPKLCDHRNFFNFFLQKMQNLHLCLLSIK